jgi:hypothetical protein
MDRKNLVAVIIFMLIIAGLFVVSRTGQQVEQKKASEVTIVSPTSANNVLQTAFVYNPLETDTRVQLKNGRANLTEGSEAAGFVTLGDKFAESGSAIVTTTNFNYGGSGVFVYLTPYEAMEGGWQMSDAQLLGDRVKVEEIKTGSKKIEVTYYDYGPEQSMADTPNVRIEKVFTYSEGKLTAVN